MPKQGKEGGFFRKEKRNTPTEQEAKSTTLTNFTNEISGIPFTRMYSLLCKILSRTIGGKPVVLASTISLQYCVAAAWVVGMERKEEEEEKGDPSPPLPKQQENIERQKSTMALPGRLQQ